MGRDARDIIISKNRLNVKTKELLERLIADETFISEGEVEGFYCYDMCFRNICLTEILEKYTLKEIRESYILEADGQNGFEWKFYINEVMCKDIVDTYYESDESISKQIDKVLAEVSIEDRLLAQLNGVLKYYLKTNAC